MQDLNSSCLRTVPMWRRGAFPTHLGMRNSSVDWSLELAGGPDLTEEDTAAKIDSTTGQATIPKKKHHKTSPGCSVASARRFWVDTWCQPRSDAQARGSRQSISRYVKLVTRIARWWSALARTATVENRLVHAPPGPNPDPRWKPTILNALNPGRNAHRILRTEMGREKSAELRPGDRRVGSRSW